jgi:hypothetical protein
MARQVDLVLADMDTALLPDDARSVQDLGPAVAPGAVRGRRRRLPRRTGETRSV